MHDFIYILIAFFSTAVAAMLLYPWVLKRAYIQNLNVGQKSTGASSRQPKLRLGGAVLTPSVLIGMIVALILGYEGAGMNTSIKTTTLLLGCGVMLVYLVGLLDDLLGLPSRMCLTVQLIATVALPLSGVYFHDMNGLMGFHDIPMWIGMILTMLFMVMIINAVNSVDNIDGLGAIYTMMCLSTFGYCFWLSGNLIYTYIATAMIGGLSIFLCYNMFGSKERKTKVYMGKSGAMMLGFSVAYLAVKYISSEQMAWPAPQWRMLVCLALLWLPCLDLCRVIAERLLRGECATTHDKRHIHYRLMASGIYGRMTMLFIMTIIIIFFILDIVLGMAGVSLTWILVANILFYSILMMGVEYRASAYKDMMASKSNIRERFAVNAQKAKKICILTPRFPLPENGGDVLRINNIARQLKREGYELILVSFEEDGNPQLFEAGRIYDKVYTVHRNRLNSLWQSVLHLCSGRAMQCGYYYSANYRKTLRMVIEREKPDLYIAHLLRMMPYLDKEGLHDRSIIEMTDALSKTYSLSGKSKGNFLLRMIYAMERHLIRRAEQYAMMHFPLNVLVSEADTDYLRTLSPHNEGLAVYTNGVDVLPSPCNEYDSDKIVFVGNMRTLQNQDAVFAFVQDIFPLILQRIPTARFYIVGAQPSPEILALASEHIIVTGFVDDIAATIQDAAIAVAPVRVAAGIQNKVLVAMGCGLPVVLTTLISRAIPELEDEKNCVIRDDSVAIAESCIWLMRHPSARNTLAKAGYEMVRQHYGWEEKLRNYALGKK